MGLKILCKKSFQSAKLLSDETQIPRVYTWGQREGNPSRGDVFINWGLYGEDCRKFFRKYTDLSENSIIINKTFPGDKLVCITKAQDAGVPVPETLSMGNTTPNLDDGWIFKPKYSQQGRGIIRITSRQQAIDLGRNTPGYLQREVKNRKYEVRCTAFKWMPKEKWGVWKKLHNDRGQLCWNHDNGGVFEVVDPPHDYPLFHRIKEHCLKLLDAFKLEFGAFDFIIGADWNEMFLEVNTRPGFTEYGIGPYTDALNALKDRSERDLMNIACLHASTFQTIWDGSEVNNVEETNVEPVQEQPRNRTEIRSNVERSSVDESTRVATMGFDGYFRPFDAVAELERPLREMLEVWKRTYNININPNINQILEVIRNG